MEKEDDYNSEERKEGIQTTGTPEGEIENRGYATEEKDLFPGSSAAETWRDSRKDPKKRV